MDSRKDTLYLSPEFPFRIFRGAGSTQAVPSLHWHDCLELNYITSGKGINIIGDIEYPTNPGEVYVINNNEHHYAFCHDSLELLVIIFDPVFIYHNSTFDFDYLKPFFERKIYFHNRISAESSISREIGSIMIEIEKECSEKNSGYPLFVKALLMKILALLYRHLKLEGKLADELLEKQRSFDRIKEAISYINSNYSRDLSLNDIARISYMNPTYFSSYFKKVMNMTLSQYILSLRINNAAVLLKQTSKSVTEICSESGFSSLSYFNEAFRKLTDYSPSEYRQSENIRK